MCEIPLSKGEEAARAMECEEELKAYGVEESTFVQFEMAECDGKAHGLCPKAMQVLYGAPADEVMPELKEHPEGRDLRGGPEIPGRIRRTRLNC
jgi:hypothetical protein